MTNSPLTARCTETFPDKGLTMTETELRRLYGWAKIAPDGPVVAGEIGAWRITCHAGRYGVDDVV